LILHQLDAQRGYLPHVLPASPDDIPWCLHSASLRCVNSFAGVWAGGKSNAFWSLTENGGSPVFWLPGDSVWKHIEHHFRFLKISLAPKVENVRTSSGSQGIRCVRVDGSLQLPRGHELKAFKLVKCRYTAAVTTTILLISPVYSITLLCDDQDRSSFEFEPDLDQTTWLESNFKLRICCKGYHNVPTSPVQNDKVIRRGLDQVSRCY
jgi:hypothetical protein